MTFGSGDAFLSATFLAIGLRLARHAEAGRGRFGRAESARLPGQYAPVLVLGHGDIYEAVEAMKLGAVDFLEKPYPPEALLAAITHAVDVGPRRKASAIDHDAAAKIASLSQRQRQVLQGVLKGKLNKIIAYEIGISVRTVEAYRAQLLTKLSVRGTAEAVRLGLAAGML